MKKYTIIIVENDADEQYFIKEAFDASGYFVIRMQAENGDALINWLNEHPEQLPDVILSDLNMPGKNGYDVIQYCKGIAMLAAIPIIIMSTSSTPASIQRCLNLGAADYLVKPDTFIEYDVFAANLYRLLSDKIISQPNKTD